MTVFQLHAVVLSGRKDGLKRAQVPEGE